MTSAFKLALAAAGLGLAGHGFAQVTLYENESFEGRSFTTRAPVADFTGTGFNDRASSALVSRDRWEVCEDRRYGGRCVVLQPGQYPSLRAMGLNDRISSARALGRDARIDDERYAPAPQASYDGRRRANERLYEAQVTSAHAVLGPPERRCWTEREQLGPNRGASNVPNALIGAVLGGVLGHQIGGGRGQDLATVGGVVAGAAVGSQINRGPADAGRPAQNVQRCADAPNQGPPAYWDVTYIFRGQEHRMQMTTEPGATVMVNRQGDPRG